MFEKPERVENVVYFFVICFLFVMPAEAQTESETLVLINARVIDGIQSSPTDLATIVISDSAIQSIEVGGEVPEGANRVVDVEGRYALPGLMDAHVHISSIDAAKRALGSGVTTVRSASTAYYADVSLREMVREGVLAGPDVIATGVFVTPNLRDGVLSDPRLASLHDGVESEEALRHLVSVNIDRGVQFIKTRGTERAGLPNTDPRKQVYTQEQIGWIVDEAAKSDVPVMVHAHGDEGARAAILAGARSIEHGTYLSDESISLMKERGTYLVPTYTIVTDLLETGGDYDNALLNIRAQHMLPRLERVIRKAHEMGIPIVASTDTGYGSDSVVRVPHELIHFVRLGLTPSEAIRSATSVPAELFGIEDRVGTLEAGKEADLIVVEENPLEDIRAIQDVLVVISNGKLAVNRLPFGK